jgi:2-hydroxy-3-keto-5-methylthiopentenyl-1-phosphate phosphatase
MEAKEKAKELVHRFQETMFFHVTDERIDIEEAKQCALIAVDEIINSIQEIFETFEERQYWQQVKKEIEKL